MGKRIISQRRGRGTQTYRSPGHKFIGAVSNRTYDNLEKEGVIAGKVLDMINCPGHSAPLIEVEFEGGERILTIAPFGLNTKNIGEITGYGDYIVESGDIKSTLLTTLDQNPDNEYHEILILAESADK